MTQPVTMTWPQYRRRECRYKGCRTPLSRQEAEVLLTLLVRGPRPSPIALLADVLWGDDADGGPDTSSRCIRDILKRIRAKLPGAIGTAARHGWYMKEQAA